MALSDAQLVELRILVKRVDDVVPKEGACVSLCAQDWNVSFGNQEGYVRLGLEILRAALDPLPDSEKAPLRVAPDLGYLLTPDSSSPLGLCEVRDDIVAETREGEPSKRRRSTIGGVLALLGIALCFLCALVAVRWLLR